MTKCFEYAAYRPAIGGGPHSAGLRQAERCLCDPSLASSPLTELTRRELPVDTPAKKVQILLDADQCTAV